MIFNVFRRLYFVIAELGILMQMPPPFDDLGHYLRRRRVDIAAHVIGKGDARKRENETQ